MDNKRAAELCALHGLEPHPEGGFFKEIYRSDEQVFKSFETSMARAALTTIYFLLTRQHFSSFHKIKSDETWCIHEGELKLHMIDQGGNHIEHVLGINGHYQVTVPSNTWFSAEVFAGQASHAFVSCIVAPGFEFCDFSLAKRNELVSCFPQHTAIIKRLTKV